MPIIENLHISSITASHAGHQWFMQLTRYAIFAGTLLFVVGCATTQQPQQNHLKSDNVETRACAHFLQQLDSVTRRAGVTDVGARRVDGFPYLRINRFLSGFNQQAMSDSALLVAWYQQLRELDKKGRHIEISNLPRQGFDHLANPDRSKLISRINECAQHMADIDLKNPQSVKLLGQQAQVEDDYSSTKRVLGLYALTRYAFHWGIKDWQQDTKNTIEAARLGTPSIHPTVIYQPPKGNKYTRSQVRELLQQATQNPLGIAHLTETQKQRLFNTYAPVFEIETTGDFDRIGKLHWSNQGMPQVDVTEATVYTRIEHTRVNGQTLLQLVYLAWMPERPQQFSFDLLSGHLDGLVWRVTLAPDGEPVLFDSIHPCGCYHKFFPTPRMQPIGAPDGIQEWAFIPAKLPRLAEDQRITLSLQTRNHYLRNVWPGQADAGITYHFVDYDTLRMLPLPEGGSRSIFGPDGLIYGSERAERFLFWPMGIKSAGAMRQAGTQATAFVGRRHFDDADLIQQRFRLVDKTKKGTK